MSGIRKFYTADIFFVEFTEAEKNTCNIIFYVYLFFDIRLIDVL